MRLDTLVLVLSGRSTHADILSGGSPLDALDLEETCVPY